MGQKRRQIDEVLGTGVVVPPTPFPRMTHGGLGIGVSRLIMMLLDLTSIREATLFFRGPNRLTP
jgi:aspartyl-tRNA synthetase